MDLDVLDHLPLALGNGLLTSFADADVVALPDIHHPLNVIRILEVERILSADIQRIHRSTRPSVRVRNSLVRRHEDRATRATTEHADALIDELLSASDRRNRAVVHDLGPATSVYELAVAEPIPEVLDELRRAGNLLAVSIGLAADTRESNWLAIDKAIGLKIKRLLSRQVGHVGSFIDVSYLILRKDAVHLHGAANDPIPRHVGVGLVSVVPVLWHLVSYLRSRWDYDSVSVNSRSLVCLCLPVAVCRYFNLSPHLIFATECGKLLSHATFRIKAQLSAAANVGSDRKVTSMPAGALGKRANLRLNLRLAGLCYPSLRTHVSIKPYANRNFFVGVDVQREQLSRLAFLNPEQFVSNNCVFRIWLAATAKKNCLVGSARVFNRDAYRLLLSGHAVIVVLDDLATKLRSIGRVVDHEHNIRLAVVVLGERGLVPAFRAVLVIPFDASNNLESVVGIQLRENSVERIKPLSALIHSKLQHGIGRAFLSAEH